MDDLVYWLGLWRAPRVGARTFQQLLRYFTTPEQVFHGRQADYIACKLTAETVDYLRSDWQAAVAADLKWLETPHNYILTLYDPQYPSLLKAIADPPPVLFVRGQVEALSYPQVAMVGSRQATAAGLKIAGDFARNLAQRGLIITSGLALGIDAAAHQGALQVNGLTLAVAGTGLDRVYPAQHRDLAHQIAEHGALISEFPLGTAPAAHHFPQRNRIISGLAVGILVVEAGLQSGSLITAQRALEQGRDVFAVPGSIHNPLARGCHALIKQGAKLVETVDDILEEIAPVLQIPQTPTQPAAQAPASASKAALDIGTLDAEHQGLLATLGDESQSIDELVNRSGLDANKISSMLLLLELDGFVITAAGGFYSRVSR